MKLSLHTIGSKLDLAAAVLSLCALVLCAVAGASSAVLLYLALAAGCGALYVLLASRFADPLNLLAVVFLGLAFSTYLIASIPTFLDYFNGITMFNSTGGIQLVAAILAVMGASGPSALTHRGKSCYSRLERRCFAVVEVLAQYRDWAVTNPYTLVLYAAFLLGVMLLLGELPRTPGEFVRKGLELAACWCGMELLSGIYFALLGDSYLNQVQQTAFVLLYGALRSRYPLAKRFVMGSAGWAAWILVVAIFGFSGVKFGPLSVAVMSAAYGGVIWVLRRFAIEDFRLAPRYYVIGVAIMALFGAISSANWRIEPGYQPYYFVLSIVLLGMLLP